MITLNDDGSMDVTISPVAGFTDSFIWVNGTRPVEPDWTLVEWIARPAPGHPTLLIDPAPSTDNGGIVVDDADRAAFSFNVLPALIAAIALPSDQASSAGYSQILRARYPASADYTEIWRGRLIIRQGRAP